MTNSRRLKRLNQYSQLVNTHKKRVESFKRFCRVRPRAVSDADWEQLNPRHRTPEQNAAFFHACDVLITSGVYNSENLVTNCLLREMNAFIFDWQSVFKARNNPSILIDPSIVLDPCICERYDHRLKFAIWDDDFSSLFRCVRNVFEHTSGMTYADIMRHVHIAFPEFLTALFGLCRLPVERQFIFDTLRV